MGKTIVDQVAECNSLIRDCIAKHNASNNTSTTMSKSVVEGHNHRIAFVDFDAQAWSKDGEFYLGDGMHLNDAGHAKLGDMVRTSLGEVLSGLQQ